jgi:hypothetical protein
MTMSSSFIAPRSPWVASAGWRNHAAVPVPLEVAVDALDQAEDRRRFGAQHLAGAVERRGGVGAHGAVVSGFSRTSGWSG